MPTEMRVTQRLPFKVVSRPAVFTKAASEARRLWATSSNDDVSKCFLIGPLKGEGLLPIVSTSRNKPYYNTGLLKSAWYALGSPRFEAYKKKGRERIAEILNLSGAAECEALFGVTKMANYENLVMDTAESGGLLVKKTDAYPNGTVEGYASTFGNIDLHGDIIERGAYAKTIKENKSGVPFVDNHNVWESVSGVVGKTYHLEEDKKGLLFKAFFGSNRSAQDIRSQIADGILTKLSVGIMPIKVVPRDSRGPGVRSIVETKLREISVVIFPANVKAKITEVKADLLGGNMPIHEDRESFDATMVRWRLAEYFGEGEVDLNKWSPEQLDAFGAAFATVDKNATSVLAAFSTPIMDVRDGNLFLVPSALIAARDENIPRAVELCEKYDVDGATTRLSSGAGDKPSSEPAERTPTDKTEVPTKDDTPAAKRDASEKQVSKAKGDADGPLPLPEVKQVKPDDSTTPATVKHLSSTLAAIRSRQAASVLRGISERVR